MHTYLHIKAHDYHYTQQNLCTRTDFAQMRNASFLRYSIVISFISIESYYFSLYFALSLRTPPFCVRHHASFSSTLLISIASRDTYPRKTYTGCLKKCNLFYLEYLKDGSVKLIVLLVCYLVLPYNSIEHNLIFL